ncbi:bacteriocin immunity protein [Streptococcus hillyeri]|uniref:Bacteriocin immunity protein n=1 Tax=Streptococcus hillyeri TaxID=2282420 RepID=A0A3L9DR93_9STRE|nr:bacteriocin immunity protein [Streptococcus hillyeri]RLY02513.1 hypothetical protein EAF07_07275 [Streptococcus hillyeri]
MIKATKDDFYKHLSAVYNLPKGQISEELKQMILEFAKGLEKEENLYLLASRVNRYTVPELLSFGSRAPKELVNLSTYLLELEKTYRLFAIGLEDL